MQTHMSGESSALQLSACPATFFVRSDYLRFFDAFQGQGQKLHFLVQFFDYEISVARLLRPFGLNAVFRQNLRNSTTLLRPILGTIEKARKHQYDSDVDMILHRIFVLIYVDAVRCTAVV